MAVTRVGLSTYGLMWSLGDGATPFMDEPPSLDLDGLVDRAISWNADVIQFADNRPLDGLADDDQDRLIGRVQDAGLSIEIAVRGADQRHLLRQLGLVQRVGSPFLRSVLGTPGVAPLSADEAIEALAPLREPFERAGVMLALENYDHLPVADLARICRTLGDWAGICLDTVNSFGALEGPAHVIDVLAPLTINLHVKDFEVTRAAHTMGFGVEGRPAGGGRLDIPALFERLRDRPPLTAVVELWTPPQATLSATRALEEDWAEASIGYLRGLVA